MLVIVSTPSLPLGNQAIAPKKEDGSGAVRIISFQYELGKFECIKEAAPSLEARIYR